MIATTLVAAIWGASAPLGALAGSPTSDAGIVRQFSELGGKPYSVGYNERSMLVGGKPVLLMSGSAHYVRSTPEMWPEIFAKMKASGLNAVESCEWPASKLTAAAPSLLATVPCACHSQRVCGCRWPDVFWNYHVQTLEDHTANTPDYTGRGNVTLFLELAAKADLFVVRDYPALEL